MGSRPAPPPLPVVTAGHRRHRRGDGARQGTAAPASAAAGPAAADTAAALEVSSDGDLLYVFDKGFRGAITQKSVRIRTIEPAVEIAGKVGSYLARVSFGTTLIASIVIGIAVDDTIHYLHQFRTAYVASGDVEKAIQHALNHAGRALISTSVVLTLGFAVFLASDLISMQRFGVLVGITCVVALFVDLVLTPALLRLLYSDKKRITSGGVRNGKSIAA